MLGSQSLKNLFIWSTASKVIGGGHPTLHPFILQKCLLCSTKYANLKAQQKQRRHNNVITKNNGKIPTSPKPNKLYIIRKVLMRAIQGCTFLSNLSHYIKYYGHLCQILAFL